MIAATDKKIWYNAFLEKYSSSRIEKASKNLDSDVIAVIDTESESSPKDEYKQLKAQHRKKIIKSLSKED